MSEPFVFDPRYPLCKDPFGAVSCGKAVTFHCRPLVSEGFSHCALAVSRDFSGCREELELTREASQGDRSCFSGRFSAPAEAELVWYHFRFWREDGNGCILDKTGYRSDGGAEDWQLTVYRDTPAPEWFGAGVTYQIFPDRFCRLSVPSPEGLVGKRVVHASWDEAPEWQPDADGAIRNRDFFGGSLRGIASRLEELSALGVTTLYLNPIFEAASNHRYDTADYRRIDPMLGTEEDFRALCARAAALGIRILLDGVFNHTGSRSRYFNVDGFYPDPGAAQSRQSPWFDWYSFHPWPDDYDAWWGIKTLPAVREETPGYQEFLFGAQDSVVRRWLRAGASGWRLDVADELPDAFLEGVRTAAEEEKSDALVLGEVWEDASNKISYSRRRRYLLGDQLHGVMNYPFRTSLLDYLLGGDARDFQEAMETLRENYPPRAFASCMNFLGTHDTPRILTVLGAAHVPERREDRAVYRLSSAQRALGLARVRLAALVLFTFPGSPTIYYGDEAGMEGFEDPFNRGTYPWGREDLALKARFARLGTLRRERSSLRRGDLVWLRAQGAVLCFSRTAGDEISVTAVNASDAPQTLSLSLSGSAAADLLTGQVFSARDGVLTLTLPPLSGLLLEPR